jgi:hypothetical protein
MHSDPAAATESGQKDCRFGTIRDGNHRKRQAFQNKPAKYDRLERRCDIAEPVQS